MSTGINIAPSSDLTVGTTAVTSGTDTRVFFQAGGVIQQDVNFTFDNTLKRLTLKAVGTVATDIPFAVQNSAGTIDNFIVNGLGEGYFKSQQAQPYGITIENTQTSSLSENTLGSRITFVSAGTNLGDRAYIHYHNSNGGGSSAGTFIFSSPRGFRMDSPGTYLSDNYRFTTTSSGNHLGFAASGSGNILRLGIAAGGSTASEIQIASVLSNYAYWRAPNNVSDHAMSWGRTSTEFMRFNQSGWLGIGTSLPGARLDVRAQGALSTDIAFRVRNSADTQNIIEVRGDGETRWNGLPAVGNYVAIKNYTSYDATIDLMGGNSVKAQISMDITNNLNINRGLNIWNPGIVGQATSKINNIVKSGLAAYGAGYGFNWAFTSNTSGVFTQSERALWLTSTKSMVLYNGSSITDTHSEKADSFEMYSSDIVAGNAAPHFITENGSIIKLYQQSSAGIATVGDLVTVLQNLGLLS